jgi:lambda family phage tail tape measure protein
MTTDSRKIQLETGVDATGAKAGFNEIKVAAKDMASSVSKAGDEAAKGVSGIGDGAAAAGAKVDRATSNLVGSIQRATAAAQAGQKSGSAFYESLANQRGVSVDALKPYLTQLDSAIAKQKELERTAPRGVSAAQTAAAMRGVPAQFTDIATSLQGGQNPFTVLLQQGGQLKDMFGGIGPAAKALGGYVLGLVNPFTVAAAAVGTLGVAFYQGAKETTEYNKALILTGNYLGTTVSQMQTYAKTISATVGTQGAAAEALTALANSGKVAKSSLTDVGTAVVLMNRVLGQSVDEATATFVKLADEPTKASVKLNESMHYLNLATYERIRALEEQGNKEAAAALAQKTLADETTSRLQKVESQTGTLEKAWRSLTDGAKSAWDAMLGVGRAQSIGDALATAQGKLDEARSQAGKGGAYAALYGPSVKKGEQDVAALSRSALNATEKAMADGEKARENAAKIGASDRLATLTKEIQSNADKRKKAIGDLNRDYQTLGKATSGPEYDKLVANINDKFKDPKAAGGSTRAFQDDAGTKMLESLRQQEASLKEQLATDEKLTAAEKERAKFVQLVADLKVKGQLTADQKSLLATQDTIKAQLDQNVALEKQVELKKQAAKLAEEELRNQKEFARQVEGINISIESANRSRADQQERSLEAFGLGSRARGEVEAQRSIRREFEAYQRQLTKNAAEKNQLGSDAYKDEVAKIKLALDDALGAQQAYFDALKAKQEDWRNGATSALADYIDYVDDAAGRARSLMSNILSGGNDAVTEFLWSGGKNLDAAKQFGERIGKQIVSGIVEQQLTKPFAEWMQGAISDKDSIVSKLFGGLTSNKETGENWLGFLGLGGGKSEGGVAARGASAANPLYVQTVGGGFGAAANDGSSGDLLGGIGSLFGGASNSFATAGANSMSGDALDNLIKLQGGWGTVAGFASGGEPPVGRVSLVGERGPELFIPRGAGTVVPNHALGGGGNTTNISVTVPGMVDNRTREQIAADISVQQRNARRYA